MTRQRLTLTLAGADVAIGARRPDGCAAVVYLDRGGRPTNRFTIAYPHELRGVGWHLADIKAAIAAAPLLRFAFDPPSQEVAAARPRGFLHAHFAVPRNDD